ncbi:high-potential iron-sulfur protein [soil metagenome]
MTSRRAFIRIIPVASAALLATRYAQAVEVDPKDPQAIALGYVSDHTKVDKAKYPKFTEAQDCATCQLYQGKPTDATAPCPLFAGKTVAAKGWCSAWVKKA